MAGDDSPGDLPGDLPGARRVLLGSFAGARGVRGEVRVRSFTALPDDIAAYGPLTDETGTRRFVLSVVGHARDAVICRVEGVNDRDAAERLKGTGLYVARDALPLAEEEETFYHADLVGLVAQRADGTSVGRVTAVQDFGAGEMLEIAREGGKALMVPFTRAAVPVVDVAGGRVVIDPPDGLMEEAP